MGLLNAVSLDFGISEIKKDLVVYYDMRQKPYNITGFIIHLNPAMAKEGLQILLHDWRFFPNKNLIMLFKPLYAKEGRVWDVW